MKTFVSAVLLAATCFLRTANAEETVEVGVLGPFSGGFSGSFGEPFRQGIEIPCPA
ncbi:hypothetical protein HB780_00470 (plasmid) [Rhizobium lusitanum]|uniref:hypothetical protein n=1 Tax=Rhizobium lusitanum TaxID=293958 RepID=UPI00160BD92D|nr:hypothetical protein [Rhizobium lusitanum]QND44328.1 hypothetical protein HB780_00470 [Rhizobium lusitanum]